MFELNKQLIVLFKQLVSYIGLCSLLVISAYVNANERREKAAQKYEYAIFYMETEGDFVVPVGVDDPAIYSWSEPGVSVKGEINEIWNFLEIKSDVEYSFTDIESVLLNHVASQGWEFQDLAITSVPIPQSNRNFRTAYRYVFKRAVSIAKPN